MPTYPIRAVSRMTGLSLDTLRAWERRYGAVVPTRGRRGREYSDANIARLRALGTLVGRGYSIGAIATLQDAELAGLLEAVGSDPAARTHESGQPGLAPAPSTVDLAPLVGALDRFDLRSLETALNRHAVLLPAADLVFAVILPLLREVGARWESGLLRPSQEHLVSAVVRSVLGGLLRTSATSAGSPTMLFATPAGERHELGLLCAALLAASAACRVLYLGPDLPASEIGHAAHRASAEIVVLAVTTRDVVNLDELNGLAHHLAPFEVWVGGPQAGTLLGFLRTRALHIDSLAVVGRAIARRQNGEA